MKVLKILSLVAVMALPTSLVAETQSSKLNPEKKTTTPAKTHENEHPTVSSVDGQDASQTMSPKNKKVFSSLSVDDQKKVSDAKKKGKDPQDKMMEILKEDQKSAKKKSKQNEANTGFIWEESKTPAHKNADGKPDPNAPAQKAI